MVTPWVDLEDIVLSEVRQKDKCILQESTYMWSLKKIKLTETGSRKSLPGTRGGERGEVGKGPEL